MELHLIIEQSQAIIKVRNQMTVIEYIEHSTGQIIATSAEVTLNCGLVRESYPKWPTVIAQIYRAFKCFL